MLARSEKCVFRRYEGGLGSDPQDRGEVYFIGIIDALQQ